MNSDLLLPLLAIAGLLLICYILYRFARSLGRGGGSATNSMFGTTDALRNADQNRAAEVILRKQAGDRFEEEENGDMKE